MRKDSYTVTAFYFEGELNAWMRKKNMSVHALAQATGITARLVYQLANGGHEVTPESATRLARALNITMKDLVGDIFS